MEKRENTSMVSYQGNQTQVSVKSKRSSGSGWGWGRRNTEGPVLRSLTPPDLVPPLVTWLNHPEASEAVGSMGFNLGWEERADQAGPHTQNSLLSPGVWDEDPRQWFSTLPEQLENSWRDQCLLSPPQVLISLEWDSDTGYFSTLPEDFNVQIGLWRLT